MRAICIVISEKLEEQREEIKIQDTYDRMLSKICNWK